MKNAYKNTHLMMGFISIFLINQISFAETNQSNVQSDPPNNCSYFSIMINNKTKNTCQLIDAQVLYGRMSSSTQAPVLIPPGASSYPFEMKQIIYGPDLILTYQCGEGHKVSFESQQDFCMMNAGEISSRILMSSDLTAKATKTRGSYLWNRHGAINWTLFEPPATPI